MSKCCLLAFVMLLFPSLSVAQGVEATKVVVVDGRAAGRGVKITIVADDVAGATLPAPASIAADVTLVFGSSPTTFTAPAGAYDGTRGWRVRGITATYVDRTIKKGTTGIAKLQVRAGRLVKATLWSETLPESASTLRGLAYDYDGTPRCSALTCTTSGSVTIKVVCRDGTPDEGCTVVSTTTTSSTTSTSTSTTSSSTSSTTTSTSSTTTTSTSSTTSTTVPGTCGNGMIEGNERCDGGPYCEDCFSRPPACCEGAGVCRAAPGFILYHNVAQYCFPDAPRPGEVCQSDGSCDVETIPSTPLCCETVAGCNDGTADNTYSLWSFRNVCEGSQSGQIKYPATCVAGTCVQQ